MLPTPSLGDYDRHDEHHRFNAKNGSSNFFVLKKKGAFKVSGVATPHMPKPKVFNSSV